MLVRIERRKTSAVMESLVPEKFLDYEGWMIFCVSRELVTREDAGGTASLLMMWMLYQLARGGDLPDDMQLIKESMGKADPHVATWVGFDSDWAKVRPLFVLRDDGTLDHEPLRGVMREEGWIHG